MYGLYKPASTLSYTDRSLMAKQIKAIKCPQCGSTQNTAVKPDYYRCSSCGTEYFLDNDDININYNYKHVTPPPAVARPTKKLVLFILAVFFVFIGFGLLISLSERNSSTTGYLTAGQSVQPLAAKDNFSLWNSSIELFTRNNNQQPVAVMVAQRNYYSGTTKNGFYLSFYDVQNKKEISSRLLQVTGNNSPMSDVKTRLFANGDLYCIINKNKLYKIDKVSLAATDMSTALFKTQPRLQTGIATVEFMYDTYGDGLTLLTNDGKNFTYYPLADKLYTKDELYDAESGFATLLPGATEKTYFTFTRQGFDYPDEKLQLLKITYKDNGGGPKDMLTSPSWTRDYGGSGIFTDADPYKKILISKTSMENARVLSFKDVTPGRLYFAPEVLLNNKDDLLIVAKVNASPDAPLNLQSLEVNTGAVKWTTGLTDIKPSKAISFANGFVLMDYTSVVVISKTGTIVNQYKLN